MSTDFSVQDEYFMQMALAEAVHGQFTATPNPAVGCVLVKDNKVLGKGYHFKAGLPHAEVMALRDAQNQGQDVRGATAYVTLEPCSHFGRTPPCALGLINAGVGRVVAAMLDPNPNVSGRGIKMLAEAGIDTAVGLLEAQAEALNAGFLKRMRTGLPFVRLKLAMSLDGRTAMANGESKWITGAQARCDVQFERAKAAAILSTSATVLADDPSLNVRWNELPQAVQQDYAQTDLRQPLRVILDSAHQITSQAQLFKQPSPVWLISRKLSENAPRFADFVKQIAVQPTASQSYLQALMQTLGGCAIDSVWVEAGATLAGSLIEENLVDELILYVAPKLLGSAARGLCHLPHLTSLAQAPQWKLKTMQQIGQDIKLVYSRKQEIS